MNPTRTIVLLASLATLHMIATGQVVYRDIPNLFVEITGPSSRAVIDFDLDGVPDAEVVGVGSANNWRIIVDGTMGDLVWPSYGWARILQAGEQIGASASWTETTPGDTVIASWDWWDCDHASGPLMSEMCVGDAAHDQYLGVRFQIAGQAHYGWIRAYAEFLWGPVVVLDAAYEATPLVAIRAGDIGDGTGQPPARCAPLPGAAAEFDGFVSRAVSNSGPALNPAATTIEAWIFWQPSGSWNDIGFITAKAYEQLELHTGASGGRGLRFIPTLGVYLDTPPDLLPIHRWTHIAAIYDPSVGEARVYIDGVEQALTNNGANPTTTPMPTSDTNPFAVGYRGLGFNGAYPFPGVIDEVRVWDRVLDGARIASDRFDVVNPAAPGLLAYYRFDEGSGAIAANLAPATGAVLDLNMRDGAMWVETHRCCPADFNDDGGVDGGDVEAFFRAWEAGEIAADVDEDGGVGGGDVGTFFVVWEAGGCG